MALPITGPVNSVIDTPPLYLLKSAWKQAKPIDRPLPYGISSVLVSGTRPNMPRAATYFDPNLTSHYVVNQARIRAYDAFKAAIGDRAELGAGLAEFGQSYDMIRTRAIQLLKFARGLRRGQIILPTLDNKGVQKTISKPRSKDLGSTWLEYSYGWSPMVQDIYSAVNILQSDPPNLRVRVGRSASVFDNTKVPAVVGKWSRQLISTKTNARVGYVADIRVTNPNLYLANSLGLVNPASVALELTPFSFLVDWVANVGQFLSLSTDFLGLTLENASTSTKVLRLSTWQWSTYGWTELADMEAFQRQTGIVTPSLAFRQYKPFGLKRAANAVSLLALHLKSF